jgi:hypothetical protein
LPSVDISVDPLKTLDFVPSKRESLTVKLSRAALLAYTAPPPLFAAPGRTAAGLVDEEHVKKWESTISTVKLEPDTIDREELDEASNC